jgi:GNAT superfamily N-acetyltransferase
MADASEFWFRPEDLAPGDRKSLAFDRSGCRVSRIHSTDHPLFATAYGKLYEEFRAKNEIETAEVLSSRMAWDPARPMGGWSLLYEMIAVEIGGVFAAVRDHEAIIPPSQDRCVVHLSHVLVEREFRRSGLAGWLRCWPLSTARRALAAVGLDETLPIVLVGEMEPPDPAREDRMVRLMAYEKAGYKKIDPRAVSYWQPDFRPPDEIDASGGARPVPLNLILRRFGREQEDEIGGKEVREIIAALYGMYALQFREKDMAFAGKVVAACPPDEARIALVPPTS